MDVGAVGYKKGRSVGGRVQGWSRPEPCWRSSGPSKKVEATTSTCTVQHHPALRCSERKVHLHHDIGEGTRLQLDMHMQQVRRGGSVYLRTSAATCSTRGPLNLGTNHQLSNSTRTSWQNSVPPIGKEPPQLRITRQNNRFNPHNRSSQDGRKTPRQAREWEMQGNYEPTATILTKKTDEWFVFPWKETGPDPAITVVVFGLLPRR